MGLDPQAVAALVDAELARISDMRLAAALKARLVIPRACLLDWDYGHPHPEHPEPRYPGFIVAEFPETGTGIAYSEHGFGPGDPWGVISLEALRYGMDAAWYGKLEDAFRQSGAWGKRAPPGHVIE